MAQATLCLRFEQELIQDAVDDLHAIFRALTHRHGDRFRKLEREIEALGHPGALSNPDFTSIGEGIFVGTPPTEIVAIIRKAHKLGVI